MQTPRRTLCRNDHMYTPAPLYQSKNNIYLANNFEQSQSSHPVNQFSFQNKLIKFWIYQVPQFSVWNISDFQRSIFSNDINNKKSCIFNRGNSLHTKKSKRFSVLLFKLPWKIVIKYLSCKTNLLNYRRWKILDI